MSESKSNPILDKIRNSQQETEGVLEEVNTPVQAEPEMPKWEPKAGEVLYEPASEAMPVRTALPDGREIGFPYMTAKESEIEFLDEFAEHCGLLNRVAGE